jgi:hypothetical protein
MSDHLISLIRTYAAIWIPTAAAWLAGFGVDLPVEQSTVVVTSLAISAYYSVVRLAEARWPWIGVLLGSTRQPTYRADGSGTSAYHPGSHTGRDLTGL